MKNISFIIPVYNSKSCLQATIDSVFAQSADSFEIILVDDGSTDGSDVFLDELAKKYDNVVVIHKENGGAASARNAGIAVARGKYIAFLDADDLLAKDMAKTAVSAADDAGCDILVFGYYTDFTAEGYRAENKPIPCVARGKQEIADFVFGLLKENMFETCWNKLYRTEFVKESGVKFPPMVVSEDAAFNAELFKFARCARTTEDALYYYMKYEQASLVNSYHPELAKIMNARQEIYKNLLDYFALGDDEAKKWYAGRVVRDRMLCLINYYRRGCPLKFGEKAEKIAQLLCDDTFSECLKIAKAKDTNEKIFLGAMKLKSPALIAMFFKCVFDFKNMFYGIYKIMRKARYKKSV